VAFFASVIRSVVDGAVKELNILGFNQRANLAEGKEEETLFTKTESRFKDYEKVFINLSHSNKLQSYFKDFRLEFLNNSKDFHNRYWFGINSEGGVRKLEKCVTVTNSIGNISEVDFFPVQQDAQLRELTARYLSFLNNAKSELIL
jgi:hypothetical protein